jgi:hypothetical protein
VFASRLVEPIGSLEGIVLANLITGNAARSVFQCGIVPPITSPFDNSDSNTISLNFIDAAGALADPDVYQVLVMRQGTIPG